MKRKNKVIMIAIFAIFLLVSNFSLVSKADNAKNLIGPKVDCTGKGLPSAEHIRKFESRAWNSNGETLRQLIIKHSLAQGVHPALVAAHASAESSMGLNNKCTQTAGKSALTGCGWPPSCASGCRCSNPYVLSDEAQIRCTVNVDKRAYLAATGGPGYSVYGQCSKYKNNNQAVWNCILCTYVHGFKDEQHCAYKSRILDFYCQWANYLGEEYDVEKPEEPWEIEEPELAEPAPDDSPTVYFLDPSFSLEKNYDFSVFFKTVKSAKALAENVEKCAKTKLKDTGEIKTESNFLGIKTYYRVYKSDLDACVEDNLPEGWELDCENKDISDDNYYMFCVPTNYNVKYYNVGKNSLGEYKVNIKFALYFKSVEKLVKFSSSCEDASTSTETYSCIAETTCNILGGSVESTLECEDPDKICCYY